MIWEDLSPGEQIKAGQTLLGPLAELERLGFWVFSGLRRAQFSLKDGNPETVRGVYRLRRNSAKGNYHR
jgi:hypothetical protein